MPLIANKAELVASRGGVLRSRLYRCRRRCLAAMLDSLQAMTPGGHRRSIVRDREFDRQGAVGFECSERLREAASRSVRASQRWEKSVENELCRQGRNAY